MSKKLLFPATFSLLILGLLVLPDLAAAQSSIIDPSSSSYSKGNYNLNDMLALATWAANWILGIVGSLTLLMFIYGGFILLTSAGSNEKVGEAKKIITAAVVGLVIVLGSYMIIRFVTSALGLSWSGQELKFNTSTYQGSPATTQSLPGSNVITEQTCLNTPSSANPNITLGSLGFRCVPASQEASEGFCRTNLCPTGQVCCAPSCTSKGDGYNCTINYSDKSDCLLNLCKGSGEKCCR
jgi:hypothetical protein